MTERLVVIGGDAAGMTAASQARRRRGPDDLSIVAFERGHHTSYAACGIPYFVGDVVHEAEQLVARRPDVFRHKFSIDVRLRHEVTDIDLDRRIVRARDLEGGGEQEERPISSSWPPAQPRSVPSCRALTPAASKACRFSTTASPSAGTSKTAGRHGPSSWAADTSGSRWLKRSSGMASTCPSSSRRPSR